jgi:hypothetical protein
MPPHCCSTLAQSIFAEWGLIKANTRRGVFRVKPAGSSGLRGQRRIMPKSRENRMKDATWRAASEVLAQMLAVTAMLVIASVVFYWR